MIRKIQKKNQPQLSVCGLVLQRKENILLGVTTYEYMILLEHCCFQVGKLGLQQ
jgi:hypothetical protein